MARKKMQSAVLLCVVAVVGGVSAMSVTPFGHVSKGLCPNITNKEDFDPVPYLGRWYEMERFFMIWENHMDCVNAIYNDLGEGEVEVHNTARTQGGAFTDIIGSAEVTEPGVLLVHFPGHVAAKYHVLDTDYETFTAVYNCVQEANLKFEYAWILSRSMTMDEATLETARQVFISNNIDINFFSTTYQGDDCPYLP
ncbi:apolipoprotein D-like isoform X2 [Homarus americanus]|uniref:apolipoprotein D-like isoform X2 n=1 Tax=Homarus americanus TaxID=6706 RepID=UPI001C465CF2|nr:apolipoprotein D-like isoform X2 [Homarus americanus]